MVEVDGVGFADWRARLAPGLRWWWRGWRGVVGLGGLCWGGGISWRSGGGDGHFGLGGLVVGPRGEEVAGDVEGGFGVGGRRAGR